MMVYLLNIGINCENASHRYVVYVNDDKEKTLLFTKDTIEYAPQVICDSYVIKQVIPCLSIGDILEMLPEKVDGEWLYINRTYNKTYQMNYRFKNIAHDEEMVNAISELLIWCYRDNLLITK